MIILGIDTSTKSGSVAILKDEELLAEATLHRNKTHSERLLPSIKYILKECDLNLNALDALAVTTGPGSFTGLRIGLSTLKGLGWALEKPLLGISTLHALACNIPYTTQKICPILDARKKEVYTALFSSKDGEVIRETEDMVIDPSELMKKLKGKIIFLGDGVRTYGSFIENNWKQKAPLLFAHETLWNIHASNICRLGEIALKEGKNKNAGEINLNYIRPSEAELKASTTT
jgi:tRNA threonylcarbamoyladenosine biosynthesis protein TsaB